jgi:tetratricopeptide (TPR) repeat protein
MWRIFILLTAVAVLSSCSAKYNVEQWQETALSSRTVSREGSVAADLERVDRLREQGDLTASRDLVLTLLTEQPEVAQVLWRASRAESDAVFLHHAHEEDQRALAALSSLDYARQAAALDPRDPNVMAQLAWALGTTTHLQPMFKRSSHAGETAAAIESALALDPENSTAHATNALLNFRLQTLPGIAKLMARSAPDSSMEVARSEAAVAYEELPSIENAIIRAKILRSLGNNDEALNFLQQALSREDAYPRDRELRQSAEALVEEWSPEPEEKS